MKIRKKFKFFETIFPTTRALGLFCPPEVFESTFQNQHLNLRRSEAYVEATFATAASMNDSSKHFPSVVPKSLGTVGKIWAFKTLMDLLTKIDSDEALKRSDEAKAKYPDAILFHQPTMCDDPLQPNERILEIALRVNNKTIFQILSIIINV